MAKFNSIFYIGLVVEKFHGDEMGHQKAQIKFNKSTFTKHEESVE